MTTINLVIFGIGNVGSTLLRQLNLAQSQIEREQQVQLQIALIANSKKVLYNKEQRLLSNWEDRFKNEAEAYTLSDILSYVRQEQLCNLIAIDATASKELVLDYTRLIKHGFHIVAANKIANTLDLNFYKTLRKYLEERDKIFLYETNVGAGLPVVETVKSLHQSGEKVSKIKGVFSGSLSYVFNRYSAEDIAFSQVLKKALELGYTEPDSREDLSGNDVARKLLILAREIGIEAELSEVKVQSLVPPNLNGRTSVEEFKSRAHELDERFQTVKTNQTSNSVLRYIGELNVKTNEMKVALNSEPLESDFAQLKGTDALFEVYTESYKSRPLIIKGAGAGKEVTARGILTDVMKIAKHLKNKQIEYQY